MNARQWIEALKLQKHPEGGYFRETYRSIESVAAKHLPPRFGGDRNFSTAIYFLLTSDDFSAFHRIKQDEIWHFYDGAPLLLHVIAEKGYSTIKLGRNLTGGERPQVVVPAGHWFAAAIEKPASFALAGCTVSPGFDFADFEMPGRETLANLFPRHRSAIERFTR